MAETTLITGGGGFIGSHLCEKFLGLGHKVLCVDNFVTGSKENVAHLHPNRNFKVMHHDICLPFEIDGPVDNILHFASPASPVDYLQLPIQTLKVGSLGTHNTLGLARAKGSRFLLASTSEVYGDPEVHPQSEDYWGHVNPVGVRGVYDEAKRFAEAMTMAYHRVHNVRTRIVRIFNTYGPRMRLNDGRVLPNLIGQAIRGEALTVYGDGSQTRSFCHVDDLVEGVSRLLFVDDCDPVNLGNPDEVTILDFAREILAITGTRNPIEYRALPRDDPRVRKPDISRAKKILDWEPKISRKEGLTRTVNWFADRIHGGR